MTYNHWVWISYIVVAVITLLSKMASHVYQEIKACEHGDYFPGMEWQLCKRWLFEVTIANGAEWVGTVCIVWAFGYLFINKALAALSYLSKFFELLPVAIPVAALLGWAAEMGAPKLCVWIVNRFSPKEE
jgi:hypothetical protein